MPAGFNIIEPETTEAQMEANILSLLECGCVPDLNDLYWVVPPYAETIIDIFHHKDGSMTITNASPRAFFADEAGVAKIRARYDRYEYEPTVLPLSWQDRS